MTWLSTIPTFVVTMIVFFGPGLAILAAAGVRRLNLVSLAAPVSFSLASVLAVILDKVHLPFNPILYYLATVIVAAIVFLIRKLLLRRSGAADSSGFGVLASNGPIPLGPGRPRWLSPVLIATATIIPAAIVSYRYLKGFGGPNNFSQTFDNVYHLNAIRFIADTHNGSSLTIGNMTDTSAGFYPAAMHDMMALVLMQSNSTVMAVANVGTIIIGAVIWPLGCLFLITRIIGNRPVAILCAGVFSAASSGFPYLMVGFGILYPNHTAIALLPAALGLAIDFLGMSKEKSSSFWPGLLFLIAVIPGLALAHTSVIVALFGFAAPVVIARLIRSILDARSGVAGKRHLLFWFIFTVGYFLVTALVWIYVRPGLDTAPWTPIQTNARAIGEILSSAPMATTASWVLLTMTLIGLYVIVRNFKQYWWVLAIYVFGGALYLIVSAWPVGNFRTFWTGAWYNDTFRLAALLPTVTLPVVVIGAEWIFRRISASITSLRDRGLHEPGLLAPALRPIAKRLPAYSAIAVMMVLILGSGAAAQGGTLSNVQNRIGLIFQTTPTSALITSDELTILNSVAAIVPTSDVVVSNPRTGGSLVYAIANRQPLTPHIFGIRSPDEQLLLDHWDEAAYNKSVCPVITKLKAYWALDFGDSEIVPGPQTFIGLRDLMDKSAPGMQLVKEVGTARLYKVTACG
ncbi:DUF6541 family protein [Psychromicrobium lacuslunae]|uniref:Uncharacterized protein n=1 Tax=Psychromicrobium lacuslunae TaxID=1618207 RepID=A0A0D4BZ75_9MICC|nr:DUF6541 family protein [Psychromicrobium lacuslunae]AJT41421.1 hypothetical protein UM93_07645 [Psychromicrobium lacuslunae]